MYKNVKAMQAERPSVSAEGNRSIIQEETVGHMGNQARQAVRMRTRVTAQRRYNYISLTPAPFPEVEGKHPGGQSAARRTQAAASGTLVLVTVSVTVTEIGLRFFNSPGEWITWEGRGRREYP